MDYRRHAVVTALLAPLAACTFDGSGMLSAGSADPSGGSSSAASDGSTSTATGETTAPPPTTTDPPTDPTTAPTSSVTQGTTASDDSTTTAVDPTTGTSEAPVCGDGLAEPPEACDAADLAGKICEDFGLVSGILACAPDCTFDFAGCDEPATCNNDVLDQGELCDGDDLGGASCETLGYLAGTLVCMDCAFDTAGCTNTPADWYDEDFKMRRKLTVPAAKVSGTHADFPVAVVSLDMAVVTDLGDPDKLVFTTPGKTVLDHEIALREDDRLVAWVELPALTDAADNEFYVYYANPDVADTADGPATWSNKFLAVYHLEEPFMDEAMGGIHPDVTGKGHDGTEFQNHLNDTACPVGRCQWFGPNDRIDLAKPQDFKFGNADVTISVWVRTSSNTARGVFAKSNPNLGEPGHVIVGLRNAGKPSLEMNSAGAIDGITTITTNTHHQIVWTQTKDEMAMLDRWRLYVDGKEEISGLFLSVNSNDAHLARIAGATAASPFPAGFEGAIDEVHISLASRSPEWVLTAYTNQRAPLAFTTWGPPESIP